MKYLSLIFLATILLSGCGSSTKLTASLKSPDAQPRQYNKLAVLAFLPAMSNRAVVEEAVESELQANGLKGRATFDIFPLAGNKELVGKMNLTPEQLKEVVRQKVSENNIDGLLTISLLDAQKEERYVEGSSFTVGTPLYAVDPYYRYTYYDYYAYAYTTVYSNPGYYVNSTTYFLEANLYDIATEKLVWTGQTTTKDPSSIPQEAKKYAAVIVKELLSKQAVKK